MPANAHISVYSRRVRRVKLFAVSAAIFLTVLLIALPLTNLGTRGFKLSFDNMEVDSPENPKMTKPRFHGIDKNNQPFNITADEAVQKNTDIVILENINADVLLSDGQWMSLLSESGNYNIMRRELDLNGSVNLFMSNGYELLTESAHINMEENLATGNEEVVVKGPIGNMRANGFIIRNRGANIIFHGDVHMVIHPSAEAK